MKLQRAVEIEERTPFGTLYIPLTKKLNKHKPKSKKDNVKNPKLIPLLDLESDQCKWPVKEVNRKHLFCGLPSAEGKPYCNGHCSLAYESRKG